MEGIYKITMKKGVREGNNSKELLAEFNYVEKHVTSANEISDL